MSNHILDNPIGIDKSIQDLQISLYRRLNWDKLEMFGRTYKNEIQGGLVPQHFSDKYRKDVYIEDDKNAHVFFITGDEHKKAKDNIRFTTEVKIVFMVNLELLFPNETNRPDSKCHQYVYQMVKKDRSFDITGIQTGLSNILQGFNFSSIKTKDLHPWHSFAIVSDLTYNINSNCLK